MVADHFHLELLPSEHTFLDQHLVRWRGVEPTLDQLEILLTVVSDAAAGATQRERWAHDGRQADVLERSARIRALVHHLGVRRL